MMNFNVTNKRLAQTVYCGGHRLTQSQGNGLNDDQHGAELETQPVKKDSMLDLLMIMSDKVTMKFKLGEDNYVTEVGHWCKICK